MLDLSCFKSYHLVFPILLSGDKGGLLYPHCCRQWCLQLWPRNAQLRLIYLVPHIWHCRDQLFHCLDCTLVDGPFGWWRPKHIHLRKTAAGELQPERYTTQVDHLEKQISSPNCDLRCICGGRYKCVGPELLGIPAVAEHGFRCWNGPFKT